MGLKNNCYLVPLQGSHHTSRSLLSNSCKQDVASQNKSDRVHSPKSKPTDSHGMSPLEEVRVMLAWKQRFNPCPYATPTNQAHTNLHHTPRFPRPHIKAHTRDFPHTFETWSGQYSMQGLVYSMAGISVQHGCV